jgi:hypothetical protein
VYGPGTGRVFQGPEICDCIYKANQVQEEWFVSDRAGIAVQLGLDPKDLAYSMVEEDLKAGVKFPDSDTLIKRWSGGPDSGPVEGVAKTYADNLQDILENARIRAIYDIYDRACITHAPCSQILWGHEGLENFFISNLASFPKGGVFKLHHWIEQQEPEKPLRVAIRWSFAVNHTGTGRFGKPSGVPVAILGISHAELWAGKVVRQFHVFDELSIWHQIAVQQLSSS